MAIESTLEQGYTSKINLRIGSLRFKNGLFSFEPNQPQLADGISNATSCNTEYRINKRYLTTLRNRPSENMNDTVYSTVRDALSAVRSPQNVRPRNTLAALSGYG